ncbi:MAG: hypothetical protein GY862_23930, partial [Gammaproteobacteria bacterium]|nr:hypothetical protein [Gammaproteobacteria bacterium]
ACLVILDGLDEVTDPGLRTRVTERIQEMVSGYSGNRYLVTSRIIGYERSPMTREFKHATLKNLGGNDQIRFVRLWHEAIHAELSTDSGDAELLIRALREKPQIARMAANPLLLTIMVLMHWHGAKLPNRRAQVYEGATDTLVEYWTSQRGVELDAEEIKRILAPIAHYILSSSVGGVIAHHDLLPRLEGGIRAQRGCDEKEARRMGRVLLKDLNEQSGLFLERGRDTDNQPVYGFIHQTFGEYFSALYLSQQMLDASFSLADYIHRSVWHEPLLLMAGDLSLRNPSRANHLMRQILDYPARYEDECRLRFEYWPEQAAEYIVQRYQDKELSISAESLGSVDRELAKRILGETGLLALLQTLERYAQGKKEDLLALQWWISTLSEVPPEKLLPFIVPAVPANFRYLAAARLLDTEHHGQAVSVLQDLAGHESKQAVKAARMLLKAGETAGMDWRLLQETALLANCRLAPPAIECLLQAGMTRIALPAALHFLAHCDFSYDRDEHVWSIVQSLLSQEGTRETGLAAARRLALRPVYRKRMEACEALLEAGHIEQTVPLLKIIAYACHGQNRLRACRHLLFLKETDNMMSLLARMARQAAPELRYQAYLALSLAEQDIEHIDTRRYTSDKKAMLDPVREMYQEALETFCRTALQTLQVNGRQTEETLVHISLQTLKGIAPKAVQLDRLRESDWPVMRFHAALFALRQGWLARARQDLAALQVNTAGLPLREQLMQCFGALLVPEAHLLREQALVDKAYTVRQAGVTSLAAAEHACVPALLEALQDENEKVRLFAVHALGEIKNPVSVPALIEALRDEKSKVRLFAVNALGNFKDPACAPALVEALQDENSDVRLFASEALERTHKNPACAPARLDALRNEEGRGNLKDPADVPALIEAFQNEDREVRESAIIALGDLKDPACMPVLLEALQDEDIDVRESAADISGNFKDPACVPALLETLRDEASVVRRSAARALGKFKAPVCAPVLIEVLQDEDGNVRRSAAQALGRLGARQYAPLISACSATLEPDEAYHYAAVLVHLSPVEALSALEHYSRQFRFHEDKSWITRLRGQALWQKGDGKAACGAFRTALEQKENISNLLALAHYYLEQDELQQAADYVKQAIQQPESQGRKRCLLTRAVLLWQSGAFEAARKELRQALEEDDEDDTIPDADDLAYEYFWRNRALTALLCLK